MCIPIDYDYSKCVHFSADCPEDLGLPVLRRIKNTVPRSVNTDQPQPDSDSTGKIIARCCPDLQADHTRTICERLSHFFAGKRKAIIIKYIYTV